MACSPQIRKLIGQMADVVRQRYGIACPVADIDGAVRAIGGRVIADPSLDGFSDGRIKKAGSEAFEIMASPFQNEERRNFIIAHELGHLFLHMGYRSDHERWDAQNNMAYYRSACVGSEYQADAFAAAFLMPDGDFKRVMAQYTEGSTVDTSAVAKYFHVSISSAANRGKELGYLRW